MTGTEHATMSTQTGSRHKGSHVCEGFGFMKGSWSPCAYLLVAADAWARLLAASQGHLLLLLPGLGWVQAVACHLHIPR